MRDREFDFDNVVLESDILDVCEALVIVKRESNVVRLVYYFAKEYFETTSHVHFSGFDAFITLKCLTCLSLNDCRAKPCTSGAKLEHCLESISLLEYVAKYWESYMKSD